MAKCPLGVDIPTFIRFLREGKIQEALDKVKEQNCLPAICGRICSAPCEKTSSSLEQPLGVSIRRLERFVADHGKPSYSLQKKYASRQGKKIAIIGSGPAGLTAAAELAKKGYQVTIFESLEKAGGVLRYGIPEFRIPKKVLEAEIQDLQSLGVSLKTNFFFGQTLVLADLYDEGFSAVLLATGAGAPKLMELTGSNLGGVYYGEEFLMRINLMKANFFSKYIPTFVIGKKIAVIGSGNTALDCARAALRLGRKVTLIFRRTEEDMRVRKEDRELAQKEGVTFEPLVKPVEILGNEQNFVGGLKCIRMDFAEIEGGKWGLMPVPHSEFTLEVDTVIMAIGHEPNSILTKRMRELKLNSDGTIWVDSQTGMTSIDGVFAAGNVVTNAGALIEAMAAGKEAAGKIEKFLKS